MFIVMASNDEGGLETTTFEAKNEAFDFAKECVTDKGGFANVYKANLIGVAETAVTINKVRKQKGIVSKFPRIPAKSTTQLETTFTKAEKKKPSLSPVLAEIAQDVSIPREMDEVEENDIPIGARCALDRNMAVGRKKGPTGEYVYLCMDCMGSVING
jgi:hypothetical protein